MAETQGLVAVSDPQWPNALLLEEERLEDIINYLNYSKQEISRHNSYDYIKQNCLAVIDLEDRENKANVQVMPLNDLFISEDNCESRAYSCCLKCSLGFIDYTDRPSNEFRYVIVYQDDLTRFTILKPLKEKKGNEILHCLHEIFSLIGVPAKIYTSEKTVLESLILTKIGSFCENFSTKIKLLKNRNFEEEECRRIDESIQNWMKVNCSTDWSYGLFVVQFHNNCYFNKIIQTSPFEALFKPNYTYTRKTYTRYLVEKRDESACTEQTGENTAAVVLDRDDNTEQKSKPIGTQQGVDSNIPLLQKYVWDESQGEFNKEKVSSEKSKEENEQQKNEEEKGSSKEIKNKVISMEDQEIRIANATREVESKLLLTTCSVKEDDCGELIKLRPEQLPEVKVKELVHRELLNQVFESSVSCRLTENGSEAEEVTLPPTENGNDLQLLSQALSNNGYESVDESERLTENGCELIGLSQDLTEKGFVMVEDYRERSDSGGESLEECEEFENRDDSIEAFNQSTDNFCQQVGEYRELLNNDCELMEDKALRNEVEVDTGNEPCHEVLDSEGNVRQLEAIKRLRDTPVERATPLKLVPLYNKKSKEYIKVMPKIDHREDWYECDIKPLATNDTSSVSRCVKGASSHVQNYCLGCKKKRIKPQLKSAKEYCYETGSTVRVRVPMKERRRGCPNFILAVVMEQLANGDYKVATPCGILKESFKKEQLSPCNYLMFKAGESPRTKEIETCEALMWQMHFPEEEQLTKCTCEKDLGFCNPSFSYHHKCLRHMT